MRNNLVGFSEETLQKYNLIRTQPVWFNEGEEVLPGICIWQTFTSRITKLLSCSHVGAKTACGMDNFFFLQNHELQLFELLASMMGISTTSYFCFWFHWYILSYFYHSIMCGIPFLSSLLGWRAGRKNESFSTMGKRMSNLIGRWCRFCAWSGRLWHHCRTSLIPW